MCNYKTLLNRYVPTSTYKSVKNYAIDLWKIIFEFFIIFHHFMGSKNGGSFVEFYFLISGYLLCNSYYKNKNQSIYLYMKKRIKTFWPTYLLAFIIIYLVKIGFTFNIDYLPEAFMLQGLGFYSINYPMWYLSVLLLITPLILLFLKYYHEKSFNYFAVIIIALVYFNMLKAGLETWDLYGIYYTAWWRGFADMLIGVLIFKFTKFLSEKEYKSYKIFFNILEILSSLILIAIFLIPYNLHFISIIFQIALIICILSPYSLYKKISKNIFVNFFSKYQFGIYVNQVIAIEFVDFLKIPIPDIIQFVLIVICDLTFTIIIQYLFKIFFNLFKYKRKQKLNV